MEKNKLASTPMSQSIYFHVSQQCNAEPIRNLIKDIQDRSPKAKAEVHSSGTKEELVENLRRAVDARFATIEEVQKLLWDSEETGRQHILLLQPDNDLGDEFGTKVDLSDCSAVAVALFDEVPLESLFPRYDYPSEGYQWTDFRLMSDGGWLAKAYGKEFYRTSIGNPETTDAGNGEVSEIRRFRWKEVKPTLVARWRPNSQLLEMRIDVSQLPNEKTETRREALWQLLEPVCTPATMKGVNIQGLIDSLILERGEEDNKLRYTISRVELTDPRSGQIRVIPKGPDAIDNEPGRSASLNAMLENGFVASMVRVEWRHDAQGCPKSMTSPVSVVLEKTENGPELRILKNITCDIYEYIFNQLRVRL